MSNLFQNDAIKELQETVKLSLNELAQVCHENSYKAGWWYDTETGTDLRTGFILPYAVATKLCLIHSEISEAMEGHRKGLQDDKLPHRSMLEVELTDALIRIFDLAGALNLDIGGAFVEKIAFNLERPDHKTVNRRKPGGKLY